ncbi:hypothetical protein AM305_08199 [Actinobacillus minor NM305]|uniref:Uncharacterized protein n=1 Tax=Actinobacillus minor NM305 TaxID=637911 RepID=C5S162_9PAST|nr:hypothetical protein AM305_08199 [Actinobacillus minor NM305]
MAFYVRVCLAFNKRQRRSLFFAQSRRKNCRLVILNKVFLTQSGQKRSPSLRVVPKKALAVVVKLVNSPAINGVLRLAEGFFRRQRSFLLKAKQTLN